MSLKYLISTLQARPDAVNLAPGEFEQLLNDVQIGRNTAKAQEEFYDSMDKVLAELRAHPVEIEPFLRPVTKKLAADYESIIRNPMDLGTVAKNVKNKAYRSKKKFAQDLNLIWENALKYNVQEGHIIRAQAVFCRKLANHLLEVVPDRADVTEHHGRLGVPGMQLNGAGEYASKLEGEIDVSVGEDNGFMGGERSRLTDRIMRPGYNPLQAGLGDMPAILRSSTTMQPLELLLKTDQPLENKKKQSLRARHRSAQAGPAWYPFPMAPAVKAEDGSETRNGIYKPEEAAAEMARDSRWWSICNDSSLLGEVLPPACHVDGALIPSRKRKRRQPRSEELDLSNSISLRTVVDTNLSTLTKVRRRYAFLSSRMADPDWDDPLPLSSDEEAERPTVDTKFTPKRLTQSVSGMEAFGALKETTASMLAHTGFESCGGLTLDLCTQLLATFITNFGKSVSALLDRDGATANTEAALEHAMLSNGMTQTNDLDLYLREDLTRYGLRLEEAAKKLKQAIADMDVDVEERSVEEEDLMFGGIPGMDNMEDFWGMEIPVVPKRLLAGKRRVAEPAAAAQSKIPIVDPYEPPIGFSPFTAADVSEQIGLLRDFFTLKLEEVGDPLPEEDFDPALPAMGPLGQIVQRTTAAFKKKPETSNAKVPKRGATRGRGLSSTRGRGGRGGKASWMDTAQDGEPDDDVEMDPAE